MYNGFFPLEFTVLSFIQAKAKITSEGVFLEQLETDPSKYMPEIDDSQLGGEVIQVIFYTYHNLLNIVNVLCYFLCVNVIH